MWAVNRVLHWTLVAVIVVPIILTLLLLVSLALLPIDGPSAFACTETRIITIDAEVAPDRDGRIVGRDFLGCTVWWYGI